MSIKTARMRRTVLSIMEDYSLFSLVCWGNDSEMGGTYRGKAYVQGGGYRSRTALYLRQNRWYAMPHRPLNTMVTPFRFGFSYAKIVYYLLSSCRLYKKRPSSWWCPLIFFRFPVFKTEKGGSTVCLADVISGMVLKKIQEEKCWVWKSVQFFFRLSGSLHAAAFDVSVTAWEGRRKPTGKSLFEISQKWSIRVLRPFSVCFPVFSAGKLKTSDFFDTKFRCLSLKVRMFCLEKSGVFGVKIAWFTPYLRNFMPTFPP